MKATTFCCCVAAAPYADETAYNLNINIYHHIGTGVWSGDKRATIVNNNFLYIAEPAVKNNGEVFVRAYRQRPSFCSFDMLTCWRSGHALTTVKYIFNYFRWLPVILEQAPVSMVRHEQLK